MTKSEKKQLTGWVTGPGEELYEAKITLKFVCKKGMSFKEIHERLFALVRGDLNGAAAARLASFMDLSKHDQER